MECDTLRDRVQIMYRTDFRHSPELQYDVAARDSVGSFFVHLKFCFLLLCCSGDWRCDA